MQTGSLFGVLIAGLAISACLDLNDELLSKKSDDTENDMSAVLDAGQTAPSDTEADDHKPDTPPGADVDSDAPCPKLDGTTCAARADCAVIEAERYVKEQNCFEVISPMGCRTAKMACSDVWRAGMGEDGTCWRFHNGCLPAGFVDFYAKPTLLPSSCGYNDDDGIPTCLDDNGGCPDAKMKLEGMCYSCDQVSFRISLAISDSTESHNQCQTDDDCTLAGVSIDCITACPSAIAVDEEKAFDLATEEMNLTLCEETGYRDWCLISSEDCFYEKALCEDGKCSPVW